MAKFKPGETPPGAVPISEAIAKEYQRRSVEARRENKTLRETLLASLREMTPDGIHTKLEALVIKALDNHYRGKLTFKDLKDLSAVLGEATLNVKTDGAVNISVGDQATADALAAVLRAGGKPRDPENK